MTDVLQGTASELMRVDPDALSQEELRKYISKLSPKAKAELNRRLESRMNEERRVWYCGDRECDGRPHDVYNYPHARGSKREDQRGSQYPPLGTDWVTWLMLAGRGSGKSKTGSEYTRYISKKIRYLALVGPTSSALRNVMIEGKALALDTPVPTPSGWTTMGALSEGDIIYGGDGRPCRVTAAYAVRHDRPCYEVIVEGARIVADAEHLWETSNHRERQYQRRDGVRRFGVRTTQDIVDDLQATGLGVSNHAIAGACIADSPRLDLPIDPYVLGAWLGDGTSKSGEITQHEDDQPHLRARIEEAGYVVTKRSDPQSMGVLGLHKDLRESGLLRNKHIPAAYFRASREQRLSLLQGLVDTDGSISGRGQVEFVNKNKRLVAGVVELASSLGIKVRVTRKGPYGRVRFTTSLPVARLPGKAARIKGLGPEEAWRYIRDIKPVQSVPVRCISVDSPDRTFLVTEHFIRTHNSGLIKACEAAGEKCHYEPSKQRITFQNGAEATLFTAEEPERIRGANLGFAWCDEPAFWTDPQMVWDMLMFTLRDGIRPHVLATTTPLPSDFIKGLVASPTTRAVSGSTYDNRDNLPAVFFQQILDKYEGTYLGRQEIYGEIIDDREGSLWSSEQFTEADFYFELEHVQMDRVVVGIDPAGSNNKRSDLTGIIVGGIRNEVLHAMDDLSGKYTPSGWARAAINAYEKYRADAIVVERNYGGDMCRATLKAEGFQGRIIEGRATDGKRVRAEPIAAKYEQGRARHRRGNYVKKLESEMVSWIPGEGKSPNRIDAWVWAATSLTRNAGKAGMSTVKQMETPLSPSVYKGPGSLSSRKRAKRGIR